MSRFTPALAAVAASVLLLSGVGTSAPALADGPKPAAAKSAKKSAKKPGAKKATRPAKATPKRQAKVDVKSSLGKTDKLIKVAQKAVGKGGHAGLREANVQQLAARKALAAGKYRQAMFLSLEARRVARVVINDAGSKVPRALAADKMEETDNSDATAIDSFLEEAQEEIPEAMDDHDLEEMEAPEDIEEDTNDVSEEIEDVEF